MKIAVYLLSVLTFCTYVHAGVVMNMARKDLESGKQIGTTQLYAQGEMTRTDSTNDGKMTSFIFRDDLFYIVNHQKKEYMELDEQKLEQMTGQLSAAMKQMEEQLAKLPPEQREMMEKMMKGKMQPSGSNADRTMRVEEMGTDRFESYTCKKYAIYMGKDKLSEVCAVAPGQIEGLDEAMESIFAMGRVLGKMMESIQNMPFVGSIDMSPMAALDKIKGIPVRTVLFKDGKPVTEQYMTGSERKELDQSVFVPPADYKKSDPFKKQ